MTNRIDGLEARWLVERVKNPNDGRQVLVTLTKRGLAKIDAALIDHAANELDTVEGLSKDQQDLFIELLRALRHKLSK